jgi:nicotinamidase-related amidase
MEGEGMTVAGQRHPELADRDDAVVVVIDVQEKFVPAMHESERLVRTIKLLLAAARRLKLPVLATEHYTKGLGRTVPQIAEDLEGVAPLEKMTFSCWGAESFREELARTGRKTVILVGIEGHVCLMQTGLDLLHAGYRVHVPVDAVTSRRPEACDIGLQRLKGAGAILTCAESVVFEMLREAGTEDFKALLPLLK